MTDFLDQSTSRNGALDRAKALAQTVVSSMQAQGYRDIEYILTECQLKIVASATGKSPKTQYMVLPTNVIAGPVPTAVPPAPRRFVL